MESLLLNHLHDVPAPYAIFECYHLREEHRAAKDYFVLSFAHKHNYTFGRGSKADISDNNDPHISKINTEMKYSNGICFPMQKDFIFAIASRYTALSCKSAGQSVSTSRT
jgi:hypothetical protein